MSEPIVSILIPNYNNGRASSRGGSRDFIADLFRSLHATLANDPTPLEIIVADDGSTDDSLQTCREWSQRTWRGGQPFCRLIELSHTGVVARVMNKLLGESRGRIIIRFDGDVIVHTAGFAQLIVGAFDGSPGVGVIGAKQLALNGRIHSFGDWILHPRGYHHVAQGASRFAVTAPIEVDHVMGCFYCHRREVWQQIGDYDETILRGQTIDFGLRVRQHGWRTFCLPQVEFTHCHSERGWRENFADTEEGLANALDTFRAKWGFDRLAPDLEEVAKRYARSPLLWNRRVFHDALVHGFDCATWPSVPNQSEQIQTAFQAICKALPQTARVRIFGPQWTLIESMLVARGLQIVERGNNADAAVMVNALEQHPNPTALMHEAANSIRGNGPNGRLVLVSQMRTSPLDDPADPRHLFAVHELEQFVRHTRLFTILEKAHPLADGSHIACVAQPAEAGMSHGHFQRPSAALRNAGR